jgi:hypothetical protein
MNDAFNTSETEGERAYWKLLSEVIAGRVLAFVRRYYPFISFPLKTSCKAT